MDEEPQQDAGDQPSNVTLNGVRLSWRELVAHTEREVGRLHAYRAILSDLSRCEHGRHLGDVCSGCGGPSHGNPFVLPGARIGTDISGRPIVTPTKAQFASPEDWRATVEEAGE